MQPDSEHRVVYRAVADFSELARAVAKAKAEIESLKASEGKIGTGGSGRIQETTKQVEAQRHKLDDLTTSTTSHAKAAKADAAATDEQGSAHKGLSEVLGQTAALAQSVNDQRRGETESLDRSTTAVDRNARAKAAAARAEAEVSNGERRRAEMLGQIFKERGITVDEFEAQLKRLKKSDDVIDFVRGTNLYSTATKSSGAGHRSVMQTTIDAYRTLAAAAKAAGEAEETAQVVNVLPAGEAASLDQSTAAVERNTAAKAGNVKQTAAERDATRAAAEATKAAARAKVKADADVERAAKAAAAAKLKLEADAEKAAEKAAAKVKVDAERATKRATDKAEADAETAAKKLTALRLRNEQAFASGGTKIRHETVQQALAEYAKLRSEWDKARPTGMGDEAWEREIALMIRKWKSATDEVTTYADRAAQQRVKDTEKAADQAAQQRVKDADKIRADAEKAAARDAATVERDANRLTALRLRNEQAFASGGTKIRHATIQEALVDYAKLRQEWDKKRPAGVDDSSWEREISLMIRKWKSAADEAERDANRIARETERTAARAAKAAEREADKAARAAEKARKNVKGFSDELGILFARLNVGFGRGWSADADRGDAAVRRWRTSFRDLRIETDRVSGSGGVLRRHLLPDLAEIGQGALNLWRHFRNAMGGVRAEFAKTAGGGGGGGLSRRFFAEFADWGDRLGNTVGKVALKMFSFRGLIMLAVFAAGPLIAAFGALGAGAIGLVGNLASLGGAVFALPGLFLAAATTVGALVIALKPMAAVFTAYANAQKAAKQTTRDLTDAQDAERRAQLSLNDARQAATRQLQDLRSELDRTGLDEAEARLRVKQAIEEYRRTLADANATDSDREAAVLGIKSAEFDLRDTLQKNKRTVADYNKAKQEGVNGNPAVIEATHQLTKAQQDLAAGGSQAATAQQELQAQLDKMGPKARTVALALIAQGDAWTAVKKSIGDRFFGPLVGELHELPTLIDTVKFLLGDAAEAVGGVAAKIVATIARPEWQTDLRYLSTENAKVITSLGDAANYVADGLRHIAVAAAPFVNWLANAFKGLGKDFDDWAESARNSGSIERFLTDTQHTLHDTWQVLKNIVSVFASLMFASREFSASQLDGLVETTKKWADWGTAQENAGSSFRNWLDNSKEALHAVLGLVGGLATAIASIAADPHNLEEARRIFTDLETKVLPELVGIFHELSASHTISDLVGVIAGLLHAIRTFLAAGGALPFVIFIKTFAGALTGLATVLSNPVLATAFVGILTFLSALASASLLGKFSGLFAIARVIREFRNAKNDLQGGGKLLDLALGRVPGGSLPSAASTANTTALTASGDLLSVAARELSVAAAALLRAAEVQAVGGKLLPGGVAQGASVATKAEVAAVGASTVGGVAAKAGTAEAAVVEGAAAATLAANAAKAEASAAGKQTGLLSRLITRLFGSGAGAASGAGVIGRLATTLGRFSGPAALGGLGLSLLADSGAVGKPASGGATAARAGGAILTGASTGALVGSLIGPEGTLAGAVIGAIAGGLYSLAKDKGLRDRLTKLFVDPIPAKPADGSKPATPKKQTVDSYLLGQWGLGSLGGPDLVAKIVPLNNAMSHLKTLLGEMGPRGDAFAHLLQTLTDGASTAEQKFDAFQATIKTIGDSLAPGASKLREYSIAADLIAGSAISASQRAQLFSDVLDGIEKVAGPAKDRVDALNRAFNDIGDSALTNADKSDLMRRAFNDLHAPLREQTRGADAFYSALNRVSDAAKSGATSLKDHSDAAITNRASIEDAVDAADDLYFADVKVHGKTKEVKRALDDRLKQIEDMAVKAGYSRGEVHKFVQGLGQIPKETHTTINVNTKPAESALTKLYEKLLLDFILERSISEGLSWDQAAAKYGQGHHFAWINGQQVLVKDQKGRGTDKAAGGFVGGNYSGRDDTEPHMLTPGEFVLRRKVGQKPGGPELLRALNEDALDPAALFAALNFSAQAVPGQRPPSGSASVTNVHNATRNAGLSTGNITINNPVRERSDRSLRRTLQAAAYMTDR